MKKSISTFFARGRTVAPPQTLPPSGILMEKEVYQSFKAHSLDKKHFDPMRGKISERDSVLSQPHQRLVPIDRASRIKDFEITRRIRRDILSETKLSWNAKIVTIVTRDGHVTLRGEVSTEVEKHVLEAIARRVVQAAEFDNQLKVTPNVSTEHPPQPPCIL